MVETGHGQRIRGDADDGIGAECETRTATGTIGQGVLAGEAADGAEAADACAPDVEVLVETDPALQGERRAVADIAHGLPGVAAGAESRVARRN